MKKQVIFVGCENLSVNRLNQLSAGMIRLDEYEIIHLQSILDIKYYPDVTVIIAPFVTELSKIQYNNYENR